MDDLISKTIAGGEKRHGSSKKGRKPVDDYFRIRDFEYVQPLYDLSFLLEVKMYAKRAGAKTKAAAKKAKVPKFRTFALWNAGYSLDGYGTTIDRWLDGAIGDDDLDYVPTSRIREYLVKVRKTGTVPELRSFRSEEYARSLRLRSVRGLGPAQIGQSIRTSSEEWLKKFNQGNPVHQARVTELFKDLSNGPWQTAHIVPPLLRFLRAVENACDLAIGWSISGIEDPFEPVVNEVTITADAAWEVVRKGTERALLKERLFRLEAQTDDKVVVRHQMGWRFAVKAEPQALTKHRIADLVQALDPFGDRLPSHLRADLHLHTAWSDGSASVNSMAMAVAKSGLQYFAVTDHSRSCKLQGGLTPVLWLRQANALTLASPVCPVLHGVEVDILKDGTLDLPASLLAAADWVVASVHTSWSEDRRENTARVVRAIESGCIDVLAHPTSAVIGKPGVPDYLRPQADVDWETVFQTCARWHVALEMNCFPSRLDLPLALLRRAIEAGCAISIGSDAHARSHLQNLQFGEAALRRLNAGRILNTMAFEELKKWVAGSRAIRKTLTKSVVEQAQGDLFFEPAKEVTSPKLVARIQPPQNIPSGSRVVGIDLTAGDKATGVATLEQFHVETMSVTTDEEILDYVRKQIPSIVSIDSPLGLPGGGEVVDKDAGIMREAEYDLASVGIPAYPSLIDSMEKLTQRGIRLRRAIEAFPNAPQVIESYPGAAQDILCIPRKQKSLGLLREGLRRLGIQGAGLDTRSHDEMDAITSAIVGRYHEVGLFEPMGIPSEAQLIVPKVSPLSFERAPVICLAGKTGAGKSVVARYLSVFYGFTWFRTRDVIRNLLAEDMAAAPQRRMFHRTVDPNAITEQDLREFGLLILEVYKQQPVRSHLQKMLLRCPSPVVVDSIRDIADVDRTAMQGRPLYVWFIDCSEPILRKRLSETTKLGELRGQVGSPVDRNALEIRNYADSIIHNLSSLEDLRWSIDDEFFANLKISHS